MICLLVIACGWLFSCVVCFFNILSVQYNIFTKLLAYYILNNVSRFLQCWRMKMKRQWKNAVKVGGGKEEETSEEERDGG
jgi:hypothetical protein